jgi:hypothetical protein
MVSLHSLHPNSKLTKSSSYSPRPRHSKLCRCSARTVQQRDPALPSTPKTPQSLPLKNWLTESSKSSTRQRRRDKITLQQFKPKPLAPTTSLPRLRRPWLPGESNMRHASSMPSRQPPSREKPISRPRLLTLPETLLELVSFKLVTKKSKASVSMPFSIDWTELPALEKNKKNLEYLPSPRPFQPAPLSPSSLKKAPRRRHYSDRAAAGNYSSPGGALLLVMALPGPWLRDSFLLESHSVLILVLP